MSSAKIYKKFTAVTAVLVLHCFLRAAAADADKSKLCKNITGTWYNQLGSMMKIDSAEGDKLSGRYWTAVERANGTAGTNPSRVFGVNPGPGFAFGFGVMWRGGKSMTSWTGQCLVCGDEEVIETSWLLKVLVDTCLDKWKSTLIGQDRFTRYPQPVLSQETTKSQNSSSPDGAPSTANYPTSTPSTIQSITSEQTCSLSGHWYNELGSHVIIATNADNTVTGEYKTAVEVCKGDAGSGTSRLYGMTNGTQAAYTTAAFFVVWNNGGSITGFDGQCQVCNGSETLAMTWLLRSTIKDCEDNWQATRYGENIFTRQPQKHDGGTIRSSCSDDTTNVQARTSGDINLQPRTALMILFSIIFFLFK